MRSKIRLYNVSFVLCVHIHTVIEYICILGGTVFLTDNPATVSPSRTHTHTHHPHLIAYEMLNNVQSNFTTI